jgi:hypothetical protein
VNYLIGLSYAEARELKHTAELSCDEKTKALQAITGNNNGALLPDHIKQSKEYQSANNAFQLAFDTMRSINSEFLKNKEFKKQYLNERLIIRLNIIK